MRLNIGLIFPYLGFLVFFLWIFFFVFFPRVFLCFFFLLFVLGFCFGFSVLIVVTNVIGKSCEPFPVICDKFPRLSVTFHRVAVGFGSHPFWVPFLRLHRHRHQLRLARMQRWFRLCLWWCSRHHSRRPPPVRRGSPDRIPQGLPIRYGINAIKVICEC